MASGAISVTPNPASDSAGAIMERAPVDQSEESRRIGAAEKEILGDAQLRQDVQFLMQEAQTETMGVACARDRDGRAIDRDRACVGPTAPARILISVDFPAPFSPIKRVNFAGLERRAKRRESRGSAV